MLLATLIATLIRRIQYEQYFTLTYVATEYLDTLTSTN